VNVDRTVTHGTHVLRRRSEHRALIRRSEGNEKACEGARQLQAEKKADEEAFLVASGSPARTPSRQQVHDHVRKLVKMPQNTAGFGGFFGSRRLEQHEVADEGPFGVPMRQLQKRDWTTRFKALRRIAALSRSAAGEGGEGCEEATVEQLMAIMVTWTRAYVRLQRAKEAEVRVASHAAMAEVALAVGKRGMAPHAQDVLPHMWFARCDDAKEVAKAAEDALVRAFPSHEKIRAAAAFSLPHLLEIVQARLNRDQAEEWVKGEEEVTDGLKLNEDVQRTQVQALQTLAWLTKDVSRKPDQGDGSGSSMLKGKATDILDDAMSIALQNSDRREEVESLINKLVGKDDAWEQMSESESPLVRKSYYQLMAAVFLERRACIEKRKERAASAVFEAFSDESVSIRVAVWDMAISFLRTYSGVVNTDNVLLLLQDLFSFLDAGFEGLEDVSYPGLVVLLRSLPEDTLMSPAFVEAFLGHIWAGSRHSNSLKPAVQSMSDCIAFLLRVHKAPSMDKPDAGLKKILDVIICQRVLSDVLGGSARAQSTVIKLVSKVVARVAAGSSEGITKWLWEQISRTSLTVLQDSQSKPNFSEVSDTFVALCEVMHEAGMSDGVLNHLVQPSVKFFLELAKNNGNEIGIQYLSVLVQKYGGVNAFGFQNAEEWDNLVQDDLIPWCEEVFKTDHTFCLSCKYLIDLLVSVSCSDAVNRSWADLVDIVLVQYAQKPLNTKQKRFIGSLLQGIIENREGIPAAQGKDVLKGLGPVSLTGYLKLLDTSEGKLTPEDLVLLVGLLGANTANNGSFAPPILNQKATILMLSKLGELLQSDNTLSAYLALQIVDCASYSPYLVEYTEAKYLLARIYYLGRLRSGQVAKSNAVTKLARRIWGTGDALLKIYGNSDQTSLIEIADLIVRELKNEALANPPDIQKLAFEFILLLETWKSAVDVEKNSEVLPFMVDKLLSPVEGLWPRFAGTDGFIMKNFLAVEFPDEYKCFCEFTAIWLTALLSNGSNISALAEGAEKSWALSEILCAASGKVVSTNVGLELAKVFVESCKTLKMEPTLLQSLSTMWRAASTAVSGLRELLTSATVLLLQVLCEQGEDSTIFTFFTDELESRTSPSVQLEMVLVVVATSLRQSWLFDTSKFGDFSCRMISYAKSAVQTDTFMETALENVLACFPVSQDSSRQWNFEEKEAQSLMELARLICKHEEGTEFEGPQEDDVIQEKNTIDSMLVAKIMHCCLTYASNEMTESDYRFLSFLLGKGIGSLYAGVEDVVNKVLESCKAEQVSNLAVRQMLLEFRESDYGFEFSCLHILAGLCLMSNGGDVIYEQGSDSPGIAFADHLIDGFKILFLWGVVEETVDRDNVLEMDSASSILPAHVWKAYGVIVRHVTASVDSNSELILKAWEAVTDSLQLSQLELGDTITALGFARAAHVDVRLAVLKLLFEKSILEQVFSISAGLESCELAWSENGSLDVSEIAAFPMGATSVPRILQSLLAKTDVSTSTVFAGWSLLLSALHLCPTRSLRFEVLSGYAVQVASSTAVLNTIEEQMWASSIAQDDEYSKNTDAERAVHAVGNTEAFLAGVRSLVGDRDPSGICSLSRVLFAGFLSVLTSHTRAWFLGLRSRQTAQLIENYTSTTISPALIESEFQQIKDYTAQQQANAGNDSFEVKAVLSSRIVEAVFRIDDTAMHLEVRVPECFPLKAPEVECTQNVGLSESVLRKWLLQITAFLKGGNGSVCSALIMWKENIEKQFQGVEECPICYSIVHSSNRSLPKLACQTCKHKFHSACLFKWFNTSHKSNCPLCQSPF